MKPTISKLSYRSIYFFFSVPPLLKRKLRFIPLFFLLAFILPGCLNKFYSVRTTTRIDTDTIEKLIAADKYFIIHYQDSVLQLDDISIANNILIGKRGLLSPEHTTQLNPNESKPNVIKKDDSLEEVLSEVHLYVNVKAETVKYPEVKVPLSNIYKMNVYEFDKSRTNKSEAGATFAVVGVLAFIVVAIVVASSGPMFTFHL